MNKRDEELEKYMTAAEKIVIKKKNAQNELECSPYAGLWLGRKQTYVNKKIAIGLSHK